MAIKDWFKKKEVEQVSQPPTQAVERPDVAIPVEQPDQPEQVEKGKRVTTTEDERLEICALLARFYSPKEIQADFKERFNKDLPIASIASYKNSARWKPLIQSYRDKYMAYVTEEPLFHQRIRLQRLEKLYMKADAIKSDNLEVQRRQRLEQLAILKEAREEMVKVEHNTNILAVQFKGMDDAELKQTRERVLARIKNIGDADGKRLSTEQGTQAVIDVSDR